MIKRQLENKILEKINDKKAILILGPRQSGKTTIAKILTKIVDKKYLWWNSDDADIRNKLKNSTTTLLKSLIGNSRILIIDEAQRIENIGICIKLIVDTIPDVKVIATGSSSFELANIINEPLTGRKWEYTLLPLSFKEMVDHTDLLSENRLLNHRLLFGSYPDVINNPGDEIDILRELSSSYLYKDILTWEKIKKVDRLEKLIQALAFQIGNEVSYNELGKITGLDNETVEKYISLLEKAFIVFRLGSLSRNLRSELKKSRKIYFYDNGIRNSIINSFNPVTLRNDIGALWENYLVSERKKYHHYNRFWCNSFFWRTHSQQEIDYIEEYNGKIHAYEFKWNINAKKKFPKSFLAAYKNSKTMVVTPENYSEFLLDY